MKFNTIGYLIGEGFRNTFKNKKSTFSAVLVMCISMLIFGFFFILGENVNHIMGTVENAQAIQVFILENTQSLNASSPINVILSFKYILVKFVHP